LSELLSSFRCDRRGGSCEEFSPYPERLSGLGRIAVNQHRVPRSGRQLARAGFQVNAACDPAGPSVLCPSAPVCGRSTWIQFPPHHLFRWVVFEAAPAPITDHEKIIPPAGFLKRGFKQSHCLVARQQGLALIAPEGDEVEVPCVVAAFKASGHESRLWKLWSGARD